MSTFWKIVLSIALTLPWHHARAEDRRLPEISAVTSYEFEPDNVLGDTVQPSGTRLLARTRGARESLVRARLHFVEELCRSIEDL